MQHHIVDRAISEIESPPFKEGDRVEVIPKSWIYGNQSKGPINCLELRGSFGDELSRKNTSDFAIVFKNTADQLFNHYGEVPQNIRFARWFCQGAIHLYPCRVDIYVCEKQFKTLSKLSFFYIFQDKSIQNVFKEIRKIMHKEVYSILINKDDNTDIVRKTLASPKGFVSIYDSYRSEVPFDKEFYLPTKECIEIVVLSSSSDLRKSEDKSKCSIHDERLDFVCMTCDKTHPMCLKCFVDSHESAKEEHKVVDLQLFRKELSARLELLQNLAKNTESLASCDNESVFQNIEKIKEEHRNYVAIFSSMQISIYKPRVTNRVHTECKHCAGISIKHICEQCPSDTVMCCDCAKDHEKKRDHMLHRFNEPTDICYKHYKCLDFIQGKEAMCEDCVLNDWRHDETRPLLTMARMRFLQREANKKADKRLLIETAIIKEKWKRLESSFYTRSTSTFSEKIMVPAVTVRFKHNGCQQIGSRAICLVGELVLVCGTYGHCHCIDAYHITTGEFHRKFGNQLCRHRIDGICSGMHRNKRVLFVAERETPFVRIFDTNDDRQIDAITGVEDACAVCVYGTLLFVIDYKTSCVRIFDTDTKGQIRTLKKDGMDFPYAMCVNAELLYVTDVNCVYVFNFVTGDFVRTIGDPCETSSIRGVYLQDHILYVSYGDWIRLYDIETGEFISMITPISPNLYSFVLVHTPDNKKYFILSSSRSGLETKSADL
jgi:hypothetical protein